MGNRYHDAARGFARVGWSLVRDGDTVPGVIAPWNEQALCNAAHWALVSSGAPFSQAPSMADEDGPAISLDHAELEMLERASEDARAHPSVAWFVERIKRAGILAPL